VYSNQYRRPTYNFGRLVLSLVDEILKRLFHHVDKLVILVKTHRDDVVQLVLEVYHTATRMLTYT